MWIFTNKGFISVVQSPKEDLLVVRSRSKEHLRNLFGDSIISSTPERDYQYRTLIERNHFQEEMKKHFDEITYHNFKDSVKEKVYKEACSEIWSTLFIAFGFKRVDSWITTLFKPLSKKPVEEKWESRRSIA